MKTRYSYLIVSTIFFLIIRQAQNWNKFCSVYCQNQQCNSQNSNDCMGNTCASGFVWNAGASTCEISATAGWEFVDSSNDVSGTISNNISSTATCGPGTAGQWGYNFYGNLTATDTIKFSDLNGVSVPHYQIRIIFWTILIDNWATSDAIILKLDNSP